MGTMPKGMILDVPATLHLDSWAGRRTYRIRVTGETRENYRFEAMDDIPMPRNRWLKAGEHGRAPKSAVTPNVDVTGPCLHGSGGQQGSTAPEPSSGD